MDAPQPPPDGDARAEDARRQLRDRVGPVYVKYLLGSARRIAVELERLGYRLHGEFPYVLRADAAPPPPPKRPRPRRRRR